MVQALIECMQVGPYVWHKYHEVYSSAVRVGSAIRSCSVNPVSIHVLANYLSR